MKGPMKDSKGRPTRKALALKALGQPKRAIEHFDVMFGRNPNALIAYELADLNTQTSNLVEAKAHIEYGIANAKDDQKRSFYEMQTPYQVSLKAAFYYLKALVTFNEDQANNLDRVNKILQTSHGYQ